MEAQALKEEAKETCTDDVTDFQNYRLDRTLRQIAAGKDVDMISPCGSYQTQAPLTGPLFESDSDKLPEGCLRQVLCID